MKNTRLTTPRKIIAAACAAILIATIVIATYTTHTSRAYAQAEHRCTQALTELKSATSDAASLLAETKDLGGLDSERARLTGTLNHKSTCQGSHRHQLEGQANTIRDEIKRIHENMHNLATKADSIAKEQYAKAQASLKDALKTSDTFDSALEVKEFREQALSALKATPSTRAQYISATTQYKNLAKALNDAVATIAHQTATNSANPPEANAVEDNSYPAPPQPNTSTGDSYSPGANSEPAPAPAPAQTGGGNSNDGGWVVREETECWQVIIDPETGKSVTVSCTP